MCIVHIEFYKKHFVRVVMVFSIEHIVLISINLKMKQTKKMKNRSLRYSSIDVTIIMDSKRNIHRKGTRCCSLLIARCDHRCSLALIFTPHFEK